VATLRRSLQPQTGQGEVMCDGSSGDPDSFALECGLAAFKEGRGAFAHVLRGEHEAELRGLVFEAFLDAAFSRRC
jgi:hypothetical protein